MTYHQSFGRMTWVLALALLVVPAFAAPALEAGQAHEDPGQQAEAAEAVETPVKQIKMFAENWKWSPNLIRVPAGTRLSLEIENVDSPHRFDLKKLGVRVALPEGETTLVDFVVEKPGTYRWRCSRPCGNGCAKMTGKLIVEEPSEP